MAIDGKGAVLDAGTVGVLWKFENAVAEGPNGWKGLTTVSDSIIEVPELLWPTVRRRVGGILDMSTGCLRYEEGVRADKCLTRCFLW